MVVKTELEIKKIPLNREISYPQPNFFDLGELHLNLLENKQKLKKKAPKPIFVDGQHDSGGGYDSDNGFDDRDGDDILGDLERKYGGGGDRHHHHHDIDDPDIDDELERDTAASVRSEDATVDHRRDHDRDDDHRDHRQDHHHDRDDYHHSSSYQEIQDDEEEERDQEELEKEEKADLLHKFSILQRKYPNAEIPDFNEYSDTDTMKRYYDKIVRNVVLDKTIANYKMYLGMFFKAIEMGATWFLGINEFQGYADEQQKKMGEYNELLIELGEKYSSTSGSSIPVEVRLLGMVLMNSAIFYISQKLSGGGSGNNGGGGNPMSGIMNMMGGMFGGGGGGSNTSPVPQNQTPVTPKMKGPSIDPDEI